MKHLVLILCLLCTLTASYAQNMVSGKVADNTGAPVVFAFMSANTTDSSHKSVAQKITDTAGNYVLAIDKKGTYIIRVSCVGFEDARDTVTVNGDMNGINLIMQKSAKSLNDVSVTAKQPLIDRKIDRLVMNVENNVLAAGKSAQETIGLAPGIVVYNNQIMLNGTPVTRIMVNGKMLQLSGQDLSNYLNSLRSEDIKSIEIMAHPPAEYDAQGSGGIINIILKKKAQAGLNGTVYSNFVQGKKYPGTSDGVQLNFKKGRVGLFANYSYNYQKFYQALTQERNFSNDGIYTAANNAIKHYSGNDIRTGLTYDITDKQYLAIDYTGSFSSDVENFKATSKVSYPSNPANNSVSNGLYPNDWHGKYNNVGLNYNIQTDTLGSKFTLLSDYTHNSGVVHNSATSTTVANNVSTDTAYRNNTPSVGKIFTADAKYLKVFNATSNLSFGAKISSTTIDNEANFQYQSPFGSPWMDNEAQNFIYDYKENVVAGYINYQGNILKTDVQLGLRGEHTSYTGKLYDTSFAKNGRNYFGLFPSVFLKRNLNKAGDESLAFIYTRRLNRPSFDNLNPHIVYVDNYTTGQGNPYLQPEYDNSYELNYTLKNKYVFTASYFYATDVIANGIHPMDGDSVKMTQQPTNSGTSRKWMLSAYIPVNIAKWWTTQEYAEYDNQHLAAPAYNISRNLITLSTNMQFTLAKDFTATLHAFYINHAVFANAVIDQMSSVDIGLQKKFFNSRLAVKASMDDIFNRQRAKGTFYYTGFNLNFQDLEQTQKFTLGVTYNFDLGKTFKSHKIESSNADEKSRLK